MYDYYWSIIFQVSAHSSTPFKEWVFPTTLHKYIETLYALVLMWEDGFQSYENIPRIVVVMDNF
jgi:hypothetical protein